MKSIKALLIIQALIFSLWLYSFDFFINFEIAWFSAFLVMLGSMYSYKNLVTKRVDSYEASVESDAIDKIDDPYDLYSEDGVIKDDEDVDLAEVVKQEKAKLKANKINGIKAGAPATVSFFRIMPYLLLVIGFIGLNNNQLLMLVPYLTGLGVGIFSAFFLGKSFFNR
jgi:hypothetical protein